MNTSPQPTPCLTLCDAATKGPREVFKGKASGYTEVYIDDHAKGTASFRPLVANGFKTEADARLCARCDPTTVRKVYEALKTARDAKYFHLPVLSANDLDTINDAIKILDGHNPEAE